MKNIYKDEVIGNINSNLIYNNEIKGVFGEIVDISELPKGILTSINTNPTVELKYTKTITETTNPLGDGSRIDYNYSARGNYTPFDFTFDFAYSAPVKDITATAKFVYDHISQSYNTLQGHNPQFVIDFVNSIYTGYTVNFQAGTDPFDGIIMPSWNPLSSNISRRVDEMQVTVDVINPFQIKVNAKLPVFTSYGSIYFSTNWVTAYLAQTPVWVNSYSIITQVPQYIEIVVNGITYQITPQAFQYGSTENALEQPQSTFLTTKATYKGQPLWEHIGQRITSQWENGKQVASLPTIINDESDIKDVNEETYIFNVRRGEIDESNQNQVNNASIFKTLDGTAKKFIIVNITNNYDGSMNQMLDLQEVIE